MSYFADGCSFAGTGPICADLSRRWRGKRILSVTGIRRAESARRSKAPIASEQPALKSWKSSGLNWNPILDWSTDSVFSYIKSKGIELHEAYEVYGCSRVSCCFCILASGPDLHKASTCPDNAEAYRALVDLETRSTYGFQGNRCLGDVAPHLLSSEAKEAFNDMKERARRRIEAESRIPEHLLFTAHKGVRQPWPDVMPTPDEAGLLADVRKAVQEAVGIPVSCITPEEIRDRYRELMDVRADAERAGLAKAA